MPLPLRKRLTGLLIAALFTLVTATACGESGTKGGSSGSGGEGGSASGVFPVTVAHKYGSTTVDSRPRRVVTVGLTDQDPVLALGTAPVGTTRWLGRYEGAVGPWAKNRLGRAKPPTVLSDNGNGPDFERIATLRPDLIIALYSGLTRQQYETLGKIAPTVAQPKGCKDFGIPWQRQTRTVGRVLGKQAQAEKLVAGVEARFTEARKRHPAFGSASGLMATPYDGFFVFGSQDPRSRVLASLGFTLPEGLDKLIGSSFGADIGRERADLLDQDALVWIVGDPAADRATLHRDRVYGSLDVAGEGRDIYVKETGAYGHAISFVTVLSLPYVLDRLVPQLTRAVEGEHRDQKGQKS